MHETHAAPILIMLIYRLYVTNIDLKILSVTYDQRTIYSLTLGNGLKYIFPEFVHITNAEFQSHNTRVGSLVVAVAPKYPISVT